MVLVIENEDKLDGSAAKTTAKPAAAVGTASSADSTTAKGADNLLYRRFFPEKLPKQASADWDLFKAKNTDALLKEQLKNQALGKEAYLVRKDFLSRVDSR